MKRVVKLGAIVRAEPKVTESESVRWLVSTGVEVRAVDKLHAKIYLNEKPLVLRSMNLTKYSAERRRVGQASVARRKDRCH